MSKEDKQFFDGLLLGGILVGIVLVVFIIYAFFRNPQPLGEYAKQVEEQQQLDNLPVPPEHTGEPSLDDLVPPDIEELEPTKSTELVSINVDDTAYLVIHEQRHPTKDLTYRVLAEDSERNRLSYENYSDRGQVLNCIGIDSGYENQALSIWDTDGERLLHFDTELRTKLDAFSICDVIVKWHGDQIVIQAGYGDAGVLQQNVYLYDLDGSVTGILQYVARYNYELAEGGMYHHWSNGETIFTQYIADDDVSNIIQARNLESLLDLPNLEEGTIVLETQSEAKVDLFSDFNLTNYSKGLEYIIGGERVVLPWIVK